MASIPVIVTHGGKKYDLELDLSSNGETFKYQIYSVTGVEPERQKIVVKGSQLKDETDMSKLGIKANHKFMLFGTPSGTTFQRPKEKVKFLEDMTDAEVAQTEGAVPAGLQNLGNTCYLNSTLQTLRAIPELQTELQAYKASPSTSGGARSLGDLSQFGLGGLGASGDLTASLRDLYKQMGQTQEGFPPLMFLNAFRTAYPQFAERTRDGRGYAQQDAEEAWSQIIASMKSKLKAPNGLVEGESPAAESNEQGFVDHYMGGKFEKVEECTDLEAIAAGETPQKKADEVFYKLNCHVAAREILHLSDGVAAALTDTYTKTSTTLNREATYVTRSLISRLPKYLPVHFVRFFWKTGINKKAKILRKVTFPHELDVADYCTPELKSMLIPVRDKIRDLRKEEVDIERARKRQRRQEKAEEADAATTLKGKGGHIDGKETAADKKKSNGADTDMKDVTAESEVYKTDADIEAERAASILVAKKGILAAVNPTLRADRGANQTGLYELRGVVTHQGASADSGHYTAYVKKDAVKKSGAKGDKKDDGGNVDEEDNKWWWFNDEKVTEVTEDKIDALAGGGESHSALILLYRAVELPVLSEREEGEAVEAK